MKSMSLSLFAKEKLKVSDHKSRFCYQHSKVPYSVIPATQKVETGGSWFGPVWEKKLARL
jgi:hypothetical protein